jgi:hypothetical protein
MTNREFFQRVRPDARFPSQAPRVATPADFHRELIRFGVLIAGLLLAVVFAMDRHRFDFITELPNGAAIVLYAPDPNRVRSAPATAAADDGADFATQALAYASVMSLFNPDQSAAAPATPVPAAASPRAHRAATPLAPQAPNRLVAFTDGAEAVGQAPNNLVDRAVAFVGGVVDRDALSRWMKVGAAAGADQLDELRWLAATHMTFLEDEFGIARTTGATWAIILATGLMVFVLLMALTQTMLMTSREDRFARSQVFRYARR